MSLFSALMTDLPTTEFPLIKTAVARLDQAVSRLELAADQATTVDPQVTEELRRIRQDYTALEDVARTVSGRLDNAVDRLRSAL